jgi:hypothetical protein
MKQVMIVAVVALALSTVAMADPNSITQGSATAKVFVNIVPSLSVQPATPIVNANTVSLGDFTATIDFTVHANQEAVCFFVEVSPLFKGDDPNSTVLPIPIETSAGVVVQPDGANPLGSVSNVLQFNAGTSVVDGFPALVTNTLCYESSDNGTFSHVVHVTVVWNQNDPQKPQGQYSGKVRLTALLE